MLVTQYVTPLRVELEERAKIKQGDPFLMEEFQTLWQTKEEG